MHILINSLLVIMVSFLISSSVQGFNWGQQGDTMWAQDCDFTSHHDYKSDTGNAYDCLLRCEADRHCTHFAWHRDHCYYKHDRFVRKHQAFHHSGNICGFKLPVIVNNQADADWAIMSTLVRLTDMKHNEAGGNYEVWGNVRVHYDDSTLSRSNVGSWKKHISCPKSAVGGPRDWFGDVALVAGSVAATIASAGTFSPVITAAGLLYTGITTIAQKSAVNTKRCENGHIAVLNYPVSLGVGTRHYNFQVDLREVDSGSDDKWQFSTRHSHVPNAMDSSSCEWGAHFNPHGSKIRNCNYFVQANFGTVVFESVVLAWVRGPVSDGELQDFDSNGNTIVKRKSFYGPSFGTGNVFVEV